MNRGEAAGFVAALMAGVVAWRNRHWIGAHLRRHCVECGQRRRHIDRPSGMCLPCLCGPLRSTDPTSSDPVATALYLSTNRAHRSTT